MSAVFYVGDAIEVMSALPETSVDLVLSSPPFLALRSYLPADHPDKHLEGGSQSTPGAYIDWLLDVVEACDRVLAPHGSLCFELGDTYSGSGGAGGDYDRSEQDRWVGSAAWKSSDDGAQRYRKKPLREGQPKFDGSGRRNRPVDVAAGILAPTNRPGPEGRDRIPGWPLAKSLSLIPETFRWAMVYGHNPFTGRKTEPWRARNVIRWVRPNPPVGALGDKFRPATSELMVFCKSKNRYFDLDAVREPADLVNKRPSLLKRESIPGRTDQVMNPIGPDGQRIIANPAGGPPLDWWKIPPGGYAGAHYAVWPPELLIKPIKAMCPEKVCRVCGEPRRRIVETTNAVGHAALRKAWYKGADPHEARRDAHHDINLVAPDRAERVTRGWSDCSHDDWRPGLVLDPFAGSGTTLAVASGHGRDSIGIDLDERNYALALDRVGPLILQRGEVAA